MRLSTNGYGYRYLTKRVLYGWMRWRGGMEEEWFMKWMHWCGAGMMGLGDDGEAS